MATETVQTSKADAEAAAESKGLLEGLISIGLGGLGGLGGAASIYWSSGFCIICCIFLCLIIIGPSILGLFGSSGSSGSEEYEYE